MATTDAEHDSSPAGAADPHDVAVHDATHGGAGHAVPLAFPEPVQHVRSTPSGFLLDAVRRRPAGRSILSAITGLLFVSGLGLFMYPFFTDLYTTQVQQQRLEDDFEQIRVLVGDDADEWARTVQGQTGRALTRIAIPAIGVETLVVEGTSADALRAGAGHYPNTPLPGQPGNVAIAGHRTTYGKPFNQVDLLQAGDEIWLATPVADHRYVVDIPVSGWDNCGNRCGSSESAAHITDPRDWSVIAPPGSGSGASGIGSAGESWLTLTSCHPKGSAAERIVIRARLVESLPPGTYAAQFADAA